MPVQDFHLHSSLASLASSAFVLVNQNFEGNRPTRSPSVKPSFEDSFALGEPVCQEQPSSAHNVIIKKTEKHQV
jgi:hypothetical protein